MDSLDTFLERRRHALEKIDTAKFSWYHVRYRRIQLLTYFC